MVAASRRAGGGAAAFRRRLRASERVVSLGRGGRRRREREESVEQSKGDTWERGRTLTPDLVSITFQRVQNLFLTRTRHE